MLPNIRFPLEIIHEISNILLAREWFVELETVIYIFPQLKECFSHKFPTIAVIGMDQFKKYENFIHTRERPFGSKDVFIIKQTNTSRSTTTESLKSKCYMILGTKRNQVLVPKAFDCLKHYITLVENREIIESYCDKSYKCYELVCNPKWGDEKMFKSLGYVPYDIGHNYSFHVTLLSENFLRAISPSIFRFESYTGSNDLSLDFEQLYFIYRSIINVRLPREDVPLPSCHDKLVLTPKCSFEIIKEIQTFNSLYQYSISNGIESFKECPELSQTTPGTNWSLWDWIFDRKKETVGLFRNVKSVQIDKVFSDRVDNCQEKFISIDCSRAAADNTSAYEFTPHHVCSWHSRIPRAIFRVLPFDALEDETLEDELRQKSGLKSFKTKDYYVSLRYKDFMADKLQSLDIVGFHQNSEINYTNKKKLSSVSDQTQIDEIERSRPFSLKDLELKINKMLDSITKLRNTDEIIPQAEKIAGPSQEIITTIITEIMKSNVLEGLNKNQPLRLRAFTNHSHLINAAERIYYANLWYHKQTRCWFR